MGVEEDVGSKEERRRSSRAARLSLSLFVHSTITRGEYSLVELQLIGKKSGGEGDKTSEIVNRVQAEAQMMNSDGPSLRRLRREKVEKASH